MSITSLNRRNLIFAAAAATMTGLPAMGQAASTAKPQSRLDALVSQIEPVLNLENAHTKDRVHLRYYSATGYDMGAIAQLNWIMRDWRDNIAVQIDVRLFWALSAIRVAALRDGHSGRMILLSGYRTQRTNRLLRERGIGAAANSLHLSGKAADITMEGVKIDHLADYAAWLEVGGVGAYERSRFVHIDSGRERRWG